MTTPGRGHTIPPVNLADHAFGHFKQGNPSHLVRCFLKGHDDFILNRKRHVIGEILNRVQNLLLTKRRPSFASFFFSLTRIRSTLIMCSGLVFTPAFVALVLQAPIVADHLTLWNGSYAKLAPSLFHNFVLHFSPTVLDLDWCHLRASQISDEFLRALHKKRVVCISFPYRPGPVDGDSFCVSDDAIVEFCAQHDVQIDQEEKQLEALALCNGSFTKDLFKRLVEVSVHQVCLGNDFFSVGNRHQKTSKIGNAF